MGARKEQNSKLWQDKRQAYGLPFAIYGALPTNFVVINYTMKNNRLLALVAVPIFALMASCSKPQSDAALDKRTSYVKKIDSLQNILKSMPAGPQQTQTALQLAEAYQFFALDFKDDSLTLPFLLKEANIYTTFGDYGKAAELDKYGYDNYPNHPLRPNALFFLGNALQDGGQTAQALTVFEKFVQDYPTHPFADGARQMAGFLKQGDKAMNEFFEKRAKQVADSLEQAKRKQAVQ